MLLATQLIPAAMLLVPLYLLAVQFKLANSYIGMVIGLSVTAVPFSIWILKGYYDTVPIELEEAARIDGCCQLEAFWRILLPLSVPALVVVFLFNFLAAWNDYFLARILLSKEELLTWPLGLPAVPAAVPDAMERARGRIDPDLDPGRAAVPVLVEVAGVGRDGRRGQGLTARS